MTSPVISVEHLTKRYGQATAVDDVGFEVARGGIVALLGPNGAGKTTTMEIVEGFTAPSSGTVRVLGEDPLHAGRRWRARVGLVSQATSLDPQLTVAELLTAFAAPFPDPRPVREALELVALEDVAGARIRTLSGGQQRRVDLAVGIVGRPELLFLDEPTTGFDPAARRQTWATVEALAASGTTVMLTTHYLDEAARLAGRVIVLSRGRCIADAGPAELRARVGGSVVRYPLPDGVPATTVPDALRRWLDLEQRTLVARSADVPGALAAILDWTGARGLDVSGLEVGRPSLEDAYLALTDATPRLEASTRG